MLCNRLNLKSQPGCFIETLRNRARDTVLNPWPPASGKPRAFYFTNGNTKTHTQKQLYIFIYKLRWWNLWNELSLVDHGASCCWDGTVNYDFESWTGWGHPFPPPTGDSYILYSNCLQVILGITRTAETFYGRHIRNCLGKEELLLTDSWLREISVEYAANPELLFSKRLPQAFGLWGLRPFPCGEHLSHRSG